MKKKRVLYLSVKAIYFNQIKAGRKVDEFRERTEFWVKRIVGREYDEICIKLGYPKRGDTGRTITRPWLGYKKKTIKHEHFGDEPVDVFAIKVN